MRPTDKYRLTSQTTWDPRVLVTLGLCLFAPFEVVEDPGALGSLQDQEPIEDGPSSVLAT